MSAALLAILAALPDLLVTLPKLGTGIYNLLNLHAGELPDEVKAKLADVKLRQAVEDAEWDSDFRGVVPPAAGSPVVIPAPQAPTALAQLTAENARLQRTVADLAERLARAQAGEPEGTPGEAAPPPDDAGAVA